MSDTSERLYFAYGSNINLDQMQRRCPGAEALFPVTLNGYRLLFRGSRHGCGVATIAPSSIYQVKGLLWKLTPQCEQSLDRYEGFPRLYGKEDVAVMDKAGNTYNVMAYVMAREYGLRPAYPSLSYYTGIAQGYEQNGIPLQTLKDALKRCRIEVIAREEADRLKLEPLPPPQKKHRDNDRER